MKMRLKPLSELPEGIQSTDDLAKQYLKFKQIPHKRSIPEVIQSNIRVNDYMSTLFDEVDGLSFYQDIFPLNQIKQPRGTKPTTNDLYRSNAIFRYQVDLHDPVTGEVLIDPETDKPVHNTRARIMFEDSWEEDYFNLVVDNPFAIMSGLSYIGRHNTMQNARYMNAMVFDLDGVDWKQTQNLLSRTLETVDPHTTPFTAPIPTYVVTSGDGLHLWYVLDEPLYLYPSTKFDANKVKTDLTRRIWGYYTSLYGTPQFQGISQSYRMVGSINGKYGPDVKVRAYRTGDRLTLDDLNSYAFRVTMTRTPKPIIRQTRTPLDQAKEKWPRWYAYAIEGETPQVNSRINFYNHVLNRIKNNGITQEFKEGHRYHSVVSLALLAKRAHLPKEQLEKDVWEFVVPAFADKRMHTTHPFTRQDVESALKAYDTDGHYQWREMLRRMGVESRPDMTKATPKKGRTREDHLKRARAIRDLDHPDGSWRNTDGAPKLDQVVRNYRLANPLALAIDPQDIVAPRTLTKYWDTCVDLNELGVAYWDMCARYENGRELPHTRDEWVNVFSLVLKGTPVQVKSKRAIFRALLELPRDASRHSIMTAANVSKGTLNKYLDECRQLVEDWDRRWSSRPLQEW